MLAEYPSSNELGQDEKCTVEHIRHVRLTRMAFGFTVSFFDSTRTRS